MAIQDYSYITIENVKSYGHIGNLATSEKLN